jgi:hypothetical protein
VCAWRSLLIGTRRRARHDLAHHHAHGIVAEILRDRRQTNVVLGKPANIKLKLKLIAKETRERVDNDRVVFAKGSY